MSVQTRIDNVNIPFILEGNGRKKDGLVITKDTGRTADLAPYTVLAKTVATGKLVPLTSVTATDGTAIPFGIYIGPAIPFADIVAADVTGNTVLVGGNVVIDSGQLVFENSLTLDTILATTSIAARTIRDDFASKGIFERATIIIDSLENV